MGSIDTRSGLRCLSWGLAGVLLVSVGGVLAQEVSTVALEAVRRLKGTDLSANSGLRAAVEKMADQLRGKPESLEIIRDFDLKDRAADLLLVLKNHPDSEAAAEAVRYLSKTDGRILEREISGPGATAGLFRAVGRSGVAEWVARIEAVAASGDRPAALREAAVNALLQTESGAKRLAGLVRSGRLPSELSRQATDGLKGVPWAAVRQSLVGVVPEAGRGAGAAALPKDRLLAMPGDRGRGAQVVRRPTVGCLTCHQVGTEGVDFGPRLTEIGAKLGKDALYDSIVEPSAGIGFGYEGWTVHTRDGEETTGLIASETEAELVMKMAGGQVVRMKKSDLVRREKLVQSLMPAGLADGMSAQELADVLAYLGGLKPPAP